MLLSGAVRVTTIDEDHQDVVVDLPGRGDFFGLASMLDQTAHQTNAVAAEETTCVAIDRHDLLALIQQRPHAGMDMLSVVGRHFHNAQQLVRARATRNPNELIEREATLPERIADGVAGFGGSGPSSSVSGVAGRVHSDEHRAARACRDPIHLFF